MAKRAVLYARVSYDDRDNDARNLQGQIEACREYALEHGYIEVEAIAEDDRGARGADFDLPGLLKVLKMASNGEFDVLVVRELDRFARRLAKQLVVEENFKVAGVEIEYVLGEYPDTPEGNLNKNIRAVIAEYEALKISERMRRGRRQAARAGNVLMAGHSPYGYRLAEVEGKRTLEVYEPEAQIVRLIFAWYTRGSDDNGPKTIGGIASKLSEMVIPTYADTPWRKLHFPKKRKYGQWSHATVYKMLKNETYAGVWYYGKRKHPGDQWSRNPDEHLIAVPVPAIVSRETWEIVQVRLQENRERLSGYKKYHYLLSGRVKCSLCGLKMTGAAKKPRKKLYLYYCCPASRTKRPQKHPHLCTMPHFRAEQVDAAVWDWVKAKILEPQNLENGLVDYQAQQEEQIAPAREQLALLDKLITDREDQLERLLDLYVMGELPKGSYLKRKRDIEIGLETQRRDRVEWASYLRHQELTQEQVESLRNFAAIIAGTLVIAEASFEAQRRVVELLNVRAMLAVEGEERVVHLSCVFGEGVDYEFTTTAFSQVEAHAQAALTARIVLQKK